MEHNLLEICQELSLIDDLEPNPTRLCDLSLEKQIRLLETFKSWKDIEKGKAKGRGFGNAQILNPKRDSDIYTKAEGKIDLDTAFLIYNSLGNWTNTKLSVKIVLTQLFAAFLSR